MDYWTINLDSSKTVILDENVPAAASPVVRRLWATYASKTHELSSLRLGTQIVLRVQADLLLNGTPRRLSFENPVQYVKLKKRYLRENNKKEIFLKDRVFFQNKFNGLGRVVNNPVWPKRRHWVLCGRQNRKGIYSVCDSGMGITYKMRVDFGMKSFYMYVISFKNAVRCETALKAMEHTTLEPMVITFDRPSELWELNYALLDDPAVNILVQYGEPKRRPRKRKRGGNEDDA